MTFFVFTGHDDPEISVLSKALADCTGSIKACISKCSKKQPITKSEASVGVSNLKLLKAAVSAFISRRLIEVEEGDEEYEMAPEMQEAVRDIESQIEHLQKTLSGNKLGVRVNK